MEQKRVWFYSILMVVVLSCTGANKGEKQDSYKKFISYETDSYTIRYPNKWRLDTSGYMGTEFSIFSKQTSIHDKFIENVNLVIHELDDHELDLSTYMDQKENVIKSFAVDSTLLESDRLVVNGEEYYKLVYAQKERMYILKSQQRYWLNEGKIYVLTLACKENEYRIYKERGELMLDSFELK